MRQQLVLLKFVLKKGKLARPINGRTHWDIFALRQALNVELKFVDEIL